MTLNWTMEQCTDGISHYVVKYGIVGRDQNFTVNTDGLETTLTVTNLMPSTQYFFQVAANKTDGIGQYSEPHFAVTTNGRNSPLYFVKEQ